jgi:hypothetical protein
MLAAIHEHIEGRLSDEAFEVTAEARPASPSPRSFAPASTW